MATVATANAMRSGNEKGVTGDVTDSNRADAEIVHQCVKDLLIPDRREQALIDLSKRRESFHDIAPLLWNSAGTTTVLLQELIAVYPFLSPPALQPATSNRVCNALALMQCLASHSKTRGDFLRAQMPLYLYPFLNTVSKTRPFEYLRLTSLGVIGALVKSDDEGVVGFLLETEIIPLCLRIMETGSELSRTVATFVVQKVLLDANGLAYVCHTAERFYALSQVLNSMLNTMVDHPSSRLLKHVVRCYLRLSENMNAREALSHSFPATLGDATFAQMIKEDATVKKWYAQLLTNVGISVPAGIDLSGVSGVSQVDASGVNTQSESASVPGDAGESVSLPGRASSIESAERMNGTLRTPESSISDLPS